MKQFCFTSLTWAQLLRLGKQGFVFFVKFNKTLSCSLSSMVSFVKPVKQKVLQVVNEICWLVEDES